MTTKRINDPLHEINHCNRCLYIRVGENLTPNKGDVGYKCEKFPGMWNMEGCIEYIERKGN